MIEEYPVTHNPATRRFEVQLKDQPAILVYVVKSGVFMVLLTEVPPEFEGRGIAAKLTKIALEYAKGNGYRVKPYCSYTVRYIERHPEYMQMLI